MADDYEIVAAIDFGTTYSGYAYCSKTDFKRSPQSSKPAPGNRARVLVINS